MKYILLFSYLLLNGKRSFSQQVPQGKLVIEKFTATSILGNPAGEDALRRVTVYLPADYNKGHRRYPVIYFLHGFTRTDSFFVAANHIKELLDLAMANGKIRPVIIVFPNSYTKFQGSFYTNSILTGNWSDYIAKDVVGYTDKKFRTITDRSSRGICGHSMGGNGAIKISMLYSEVFSAVYALSPARLDTGEHLTSDSPVWNKIRDAKTEKDFAGDFFALEAVDLARTYTPNLQKPPFFADLPYENAGDSVVTNEVVLKKWQENFPFNMIENHLADLKRLSAIKLDWGRNDQFGFIPVACKRFSAKLEAAGIDHYAEEYSGDHSNKLAGRDGRIYSELLEFFDEYLQF